jgi:uncharacterized membrane protein HdeD (DUF308 family)
MIGAGRIELRTVRSPRKAELAERSGRPAFLQPASKLGNLKSFRENQLFGRTTMSAHVDSGPRMPPIASALLGKLADNWWLLLLRGIASIIFGVIAFLWPGITLVALTYMFGIYAIIDGVAAIGAAFNLPGAAGPRWWLGLSGVVSILAGIVAFVYTGMTALLLLVFIAVWAIIIGVLQLYAAIRLWNVIDNDWWLILSGLLSIAFGVVLIAWPGSGALALIWTIAWFAVFFGCMFIGPAFELKKFKRA